MTDVSGKLEMGSVQQCLVTADAGRNSGRMLVQSFFKNKWLKSDIFRVSDVELWTVGQRQPDMRRPPWSVHLDQWTFPTATAHTFLVIQFFNDKFNSPRWRLV